MKIALHGRKFGEQHRPFVQSLLHELLGRNIETQISDSFQQILQEVHLHDIPHKIFSNTDDLAPAHFVLSLGGDGTFLETVSLVGRQEMPILGINLGRLGFLANVAPQQADAVLNDLASDRFAVDERTLVRADSPKDIFDGIHFALNEIAITKTDTSSMIVIHAYINGEFLNSYWADGLMVATPTGSTGYSLSCGGPVVLPHSSNFIITPICPHNLFVRPMIVSDEVEISLRVESRSNNFLISLDSRAKVVGNEDITIKIRQEAFKAKMIRMADDNFLETLRKKLNWGVDARN